MAQRLARPQQAYMAQQGMGRGGPSGLADVLEVLLDKGLVIDAFVRVSLIGIELLTIDARIVVASVDTYLRFAEAVNRLDLLQVNNSQNLGDVFGSGSRSGDKSGGSRALSAGGSRSESAHGDGRELEPAESKQEAGREDTSAHEGPEHAQADGSDEADEGGSDGDKGIMSRIKERGQVF